MSTAPSQFPRYRLSVADYQRMGEAGVFPRDARVELIEGEIFDMPPIGARHAGFVNRLNELLVLAAGGRVTVSVQNSVLLGEHSAPEPDLCLLARREDFYAASHPSAGDILLVVEVADSSLRYDRLIKSPLYARHAIPELWLIDVENRRLLVCRDPGPDGYRDETTLDVPGEMRPVASPDIVIDLSALF